MESITSISLARQAHPSIPLVTFKEFAALARRRGWTAQSLAERFRGRIGNPAEFFHRVLSNKFDDSMIPFRSVIDFYDLAITGPQKADRLRCACGCGRVVFDRKRYALPGCKTRAAREKVRDAAVSEQVTLDFVDFSQLQNRGMATLPLTAPKTGTSGL